MIPEFIGRVPIVVPLQPLDEKALIDILVKPKNAIVKQYQHLLNMEGVELTFTDDSLAAIAKKAMEKKTGARGLRAIIERCMLDVMFDVPSSTGMKEVIITSEVMNEGKEPEVVMHKEALAG